MLTHLECSAPCGAAAYDANQIQHLCTCGAPLLARYDLDTLKRQWDRDSLAQRPHTLWRYREVLPIDRDQHPVTLGEGMTPLARAPRLEQALGMRTIYIKDESLNPTNSFKDRPVTVSVTKALDFGIKTVACASTGNLANAVAAHAARAGLDSYVFVPSDIESSKIVATAALGTVVAVEGNYDDVNRLCVQLNEEYPWGIVNINLRPYYAEGSKTLAFETAEQLGWELPDHVVVPVASGALLTKIAKGFDELVQVGLVDAAQVRISGAQAEGCSPVAVAFAEGSEDVQPQKPDTIAKSLAIGDPADGYYALGEVRRSGGAVAAVSDDEIVEAIHLLARTEGILTEPAGGVTVATLAKLAREGKVTDTERVVIYITGHGLKTLEVIATDDPVPIPATVDGFRAEFEKEE